MQKSYKTGNMKYLIRSIKYFFYFAVLTGAIIAALVFTGLADGDIDTMFRGGSSAIWKMAVFFAIVAAIYPKVGFICRNVSCRKPWDEACRGIKAYMNERNYVLEKEEDQLMTFRYRGAAGRLTRMYEDRITFIATAEGFTIEGLRKDVFRMSASLQYILDPDQEA